MVKSLVSKLSTASSNLSLASTFGAVTGGGGGGGGSVLESNYAKHRNDPGRFFGDGVQFKAKLIGILEVGEARGDRMCQEALQDLKMAIRAAGEHKQRITIHVTIDGLRLRDEKTGDSLYHHPVHKISFIAQDMTDSRAFGYIFGSPDSGHRFFGIKTDKAASQVVLAMRDLFQVVFELKKKEIEMARQQIQGKSLHDHGTQLASLSSLKSAATADMSSVQGDLGASTSCAAHSLMMLTSGRSRLGVSLDVNRTTGGATKEVSPESVADLVDLEQELTSLQRGISQMERITPNEPASQSSAGLGKSASDDDPFGDSFIYVPSYNILPPPPDSGRTRHKPNKTPETGNAMDAMSTLMSPAAGASGSPATLQPDDDDSWLHELEHQSDIFDTTKTSASTTNTSGVMGVMGLPMAPLAASESSSTPTQKLNEPSGSLSDGEGLVVVGGVGAVGAEQQQQQQQQQQQTATEAATQLMSDAFTDLDPLGTGRTRPYVDKKYFFHELKNPPKKVLKDLTGTAAASTATTTTAVTIVDEFLSKEQYLFEDSSANGNVNVINASTASATNTLLTTNASTNTCSATAPATAPHHNPNSNSNPMTTAVPHLYNSSAQSSQSGDDFSAAKLKLMLSSAILKSSQTMHATNPHTINYYTLEPVSGATKPTTDDPVLLLPRDTDPFSPTRKKSDPDPFQEGDLFSKLDAFEFDPVATASAQALAEPPATSPPSVFNGPLQVQLPPEGSATAAAANWKADISRLERHTHTDAQQQQQPPSTVRTRPTVPAQLPAAALKQQTVDVISSISSKKMPHLFGQARFSKRDSSNSSVNMRRLQESDSLSENEAAPEPPPRPDSAPYSEPPPLPPKKQFSDIIIRPHTTPEVSANRYEFLNNASGGRRSAGPAADVPPIPLPSRRVGRSDGYYPGPGRPRKPGHTEDDYLAPIGDAPPPPPPLLPPPSQSSTRGRAQRQQSIGKPQDIYENKAEIMQHQHQQMETPAIVPDITLTQLLTLGIDELALKLNVPTSKLSTMTLVELTAYLSEYLTAEQARPTVPSASPSEQSQPVGAVFTVNFDQQSAFVAKFDDTFGEDLGGGVGQSATFVANFANFNEAPATVQQSVAAVATSQSQMPVVPSADRYAVFREIIDQELQLQQEETDLMGDLTPPPVGDDDIAAVSGEVGEPEEDEQPVIEQPALPKIDTKITEVVAQAKDRYAALRDIILVENLFEKPPAVPSVAPPTADLMQDFPEFSDEFNEDQDLRVIMDERVMDGRRGLVDSRGFPAEPSSSALTVDDEDDEDAGGESSLDSNDKDGEPISGQDQYEKLSTSTQQLDTDKADKIADDEHLPEVSKLPKPDNKFLTVAGITVNKDDNEIDELMHRAISNLSLDSRDRTSPASRGPHGTSLHTPSQYNDMSTSPIALQKSPQPLHKSPHPSPVPSHLSAVSQLIDTATKQMIGREDNEKQSWATFDSPKTAYEQSRNRPSQKAQARTNSTLQLPPPPPSNTSQQDTAESPCSSDPRDEGWAQQGGRRGWSKKERQQTSSSSRDLSPWDDETPEYLKQQQQQQQQRRMHPMPSIPAERLGYYMRHARRMNSCDEDYDYDEEFCTRRDPQRKFKHGLSRSRDNFDLDSPSWYHHGAHHTWSPQEIEQGVRARSFERSAYERSTYGPPIYDKRGNPLPSTQYASRKYYRDYARPNYDFEAYAEAAYRGDPSKLSRRSDYENVYDERRSPAGYKSRGGGGGGGEYGYDRDRKSFDRDSGESFESATRRRRSFGSGGDVYGSLDSRDDYRERGDRDRDRDRDRYLSGSNAELKTRSLRKPSKLRATGDINYEQDSELEFHQSSQPQPPSTERQSGRGARPMDTRSLQRPSQLGSDVGAPTQPRLRKSSGSSPWDGEEPTLPGQKSWKRPSSAAETERRIAESRRAAALAQTPSDSEKDRSRFRKKTRARSAKDLVNLPLSSTSGVRYGSSGGRGVRDNYDYINCQDDEDIDDDYVDDAEYEEEPPTDEDKFERLNRRRHEMHQRMMESERRQMHQVQGMTKMVPPPPPTTLGGNRYGGGVNVRSGGGGIVPPTDYGFVDSYEQTPTPRSNASSTAAGDGTTSSAKFNFDDGFESDFNQSSPPPAPAGTASSCNSTPAGLASASSTAGGSGTSKSLFRFSNDFSDREKHQQPPPPSSHFDMEGGPVSSTPPITQKLRFDDNVKVSQFDDAAFEDDFAKASFDFDKEESSTAAGQWGGNGSNDVTVPANAALSRKQNIRTSKLQQRQELIKKSESVNIFAKKNEDPFEDDEFFKSPTEELEGDATTSGAGAGGGGGGGGGDGNGKFQWSDENNFAKFDENM